MITKVVISAEANGDLENLFEFIADQSGAVRAERYVTRLRAFCQSLALFPRRGISRDHIEPNLRTINFESRALIAYRVEETFVLILRIFSAGRDFETELSDT